MSKPTDIVKIDPVPNYDDQKGIAEYLKDLNGYCLTFHNQVKYVYFDSEEEGRRFWHYMIQNSSEPQYAIIRQIAFTKQLLKEAGKDLHSASGEVVAQIFALIDDLKKYHTSLTSITYQAIGIRAIVEVYWSGGLSVKEITDKLIEIKVVAEYDPTKDKPEDYPLYENHLKNVRRYVESLKDFDATRAE